MLELGIKFLFSYFIGSIMGSMAIGKLRGGVDIRIVGLITLAHAPWSFQLLWSPLMDRYRLPWLGRRRGWIALAQIALLALTLSLAGLGDHPDTPWVLIALAFAIAFASASQDIAYDAYTVDVLRREEQGIAVGAKTAMYRAAMYLAGASTITLASIYSWPLVLGLLAACYIPMLIVTWKAPESNGAAQAPKSMKEAVWNPFLGFLGRHRALEILAFVFFYKFADNLAEALLRIPDAETADLLIADRLAAGDWSSHIGESDSAFVNASTWGLMLTGRLVRPDPSAVSNPAGFVRDLIAKLGEPVVRSAFRQAMRIMGHQFVMGRTID